MISDALSIALSGLTAQKQRLNATASNVANLLSKGAAPDSPEAAAGAPTVYKPLQVNLSSQVLANGQGAGVRGNITEIENPFSLSYDPQAIGANAEGFVAVPNINLDAEITDLLVTKTLFKANAAVIKTQNELSGQLLDILE